MSRRRKSRNAHRERMNRYPAGAVANRPPRPGNGESYAMTSGVVGDGHNEADLQYARQSTHDSLIELLGDRRRSGVWWSHYAGDEARRVATDVIYADDTFGGDVPARVAEVRDETLRWLDATPEAVLVVAWAIGAVEEGQIL